MEHWMNSYHYFCFMIQILKQWYIQFDNDQRNIILKMLLVCSNDFYLPPLFQFPIIQIFSLLCDCILLHFKCNRKDVAKEFKWGGGWELKLTALFD